MLPEPEAGWRATFAIFGTVSLLPLGKQTDLLSSGMADALNAHDRVLLTAPKASSFKAFQKHSDQTCGSFAVIFLNPPRLAFLWLGFAMNKSRDAGMEIARKMWEAGMSGVQRSIASL